MNHGGAQGDNNRDLVTGNGVDTLNDCQNDMKRLTAALQLFCVEFANAFSQYRRTIGSRLEMSTPGWCPAEDLVRGGASELGSGSADGTERKERSRLRNKSSAREL